MWDLSGPATLPANTHVAVAVQVKNASNQRLLRTSTHYYNINTITPNPFVHLYLCIIKSYDWISDRFPSSPTTTLTEPRSSPVTPLSPCTTTVRFQVPALHVARASLLPTSHCSPHKRTRVVINSSLLTIRRLSCAAPPPAQCDAPYPQCPYMHRYILTIDVFCTSYKHRAGRRLTSQLLEPSAHLRRQRLCHK
jgi:hypothetical protein